jgi:hypothetical protein
MALHRSLTGTSDSREVTTGWISRKNWSDDTANSGPQYCRLKPDFKTIADFRADNRAAFKSVFRQFTLLCKRLDLFGRELLAVDGTRIKAVNNKDRNFTRSSLETFIKAADERLSDYLQRLDEGDAMEKATGGARVKNLAEKIEALSKKRGRYDAVLKQLERTGEGQISLTDPDSRAMAGAHAGRRRL